MYAWYQRFAAPMRRLNQCTRHRATPSPLLQLAPALNVTAVIRKKKQVAGVAVASVAACVAAYCVYSWFTQPSNAAGRHDHEGSDGEETRQRVGAGSPKTTSCAKELEMELQAHLQTLTVCVFAMPGRMLYRVRLRTQANSLSNCRRAVSEPHSNGRACRPRLQRKPCQRR
jgi:hypothetical protein